MAGLATIVNDKKRQEEESTGLFEAFEQTKHCPPTLISHRRRMIIALDAICPKTNRVVRLVLCSDLLMLSLVTNKPVYSYRFLRWLDLLEIEVIDMHSINPNTIRITHNTASISHDRKSFSTIAPDASAIAKELAATSFLLQFSGFDASKSRANFLSTIKTVAKSCRDELKQLK
jgi:hypothetical protein